MLASEFSKKLWLSIGAALAAALTLGALTIVTGFDISNRTESIQAQRREALSRAKAIEFLARLKQDFETAAPALSQLSRILPTKDQLISFPQDMEDLAKKSSVGFGFSFGNETVSTDQEAGYIQFVMTISGNYSNLLKFFNLIEASDYLVEISSTDLNSRGNEYSGVVNGRVFSR